MCALTPKASHTHLLSRPRNTLWRGRSLCVGPSAPLPTSVKDRKPPPCPRELTPRQGTWPQVAQGPLCCPAGWRPREAQHLPECPLSAGPHLSGCRTLSPCLDSRKSKLGSFMGRKGLRASRDSGLWEQAPSWGSRSIPSAVFSVLNMDLGDSYF